MGYSYGQNGNGRWVLACDKCGSIGGTRKRPCRYRIHYADGTSLPWCPAPALCGPCFKALGGTAGLHGDTCRDNAARAQADEDHKAACLAAGDKRVIVAYGDWHASVPTGMSLVGFRGADGVEEYRLMPSDVYKSGGFLSDYPDSVPATKDGVPV